MNVTGANQSFVKSAFNHLPAAPTPGVPFSRFMQSSARVDEALDQHTPLDSVVAPYPADAAPDEVRLQNNTLRSNAVELNGAFRKSQGWSEGSQLSLEDIQQTTQRTSEALKSSLVEADSRFWKHCVLGMAAFPVALVGIMGMTSVPLTELSSHLLPAVCGAVGVGATAFNLGHTVGMFKTTREAQSMREQIAAGEQANQGYSHWLVALKVH